MLSHRLRALAALAPVLALAGLLVAAPSLASESLRITSPLAGSTVTGMVVVSGTVDGSGGSTMTVALAPQRFGDCAAPLVRQTAIVESSGAFTALVSSTAVIDGTYCVIVTVGDGRLSTAVGDVTVLNDSGIADSLEGVQLPTRTLDPADGISDSYVALAAITDVQFLAPVVVGAAATLALVVLVLALVQRRRTE